MKLSFSPEQMAQRPATPPAMPPLWGGRSAVPFWITIAAIVVPGFFLRWSTEPRLVLVPWWIDLFSTPIVLIGGLFLSILLHELGHLLMGWLVGLRISYLVVGPFKWVRTLRGWRLLSSGLTGFAVQGRVLAVPQPPLWENPDRLRRALTWFFAGGPIITFLQTVVLGGILFLTPDQTLGHVARSNLIALFLLSCMVLAWVVYPLTASGMPNDALQILRLRRQNGPTRRLLALLVLQGQLQAGVRPRALDELALAQAQMVPDHSADHTAARMMAMASAEDAGQIEWMGDHLSELLKELHQLPPGRRPAALLWQAAYYEARYGEDIDAARGWLRLAAAGQKAPLVESWLLKYMADLALAVAEDQPQAAAAAAAQTATLLSATHTPGAVVPVEEWLAALNLPTPADPPRRPWSFLWRPIAQSMLLTLLVVMAVTFFLIVVIIS